MGFRVGRFGGKPGEASLVRHGWRGKPGEARLERHGWRGTAGEARLERHGWRGTAGEARHMIACYRSGMFPPQLEEGIRQQARAGIVALIELELIKLESKTVMVGAAAQAE